MGDRGVALAGALACAAGERPSCIWRPLKCNCTGLRLLHALQSVAMGLMAEPCIR